MDLNHIDLPAFTLAALYPHQLVETAAPGAGATAARTSPPVAKERVAAAATTGTESPVRFLGSNEKKVMVLVRYEEAPFLPDETLPLLTGILQACQLGLGDVAIVNLYGETPSFSRLQAALNPRVVLQFGVSPAELDLAADFPVYQLQPLAGITHLYAPALETIGADKAEKMKLWNCLKRLFNR